MLPSKYSSVSVCQCMSPSFIPLRCEAGQCGRLLSGGDSCSPQCSQLTQCSQCIARPQCGWCATRGANGAGHCLQGGLDGMYTPFSVNFFVKLYCMPFCLNKSRIHIFHIFFAHFSVLISVHISVLFLSEICASKRSHNAVVTYLVFHYVVIKASAGPLL